MVYSLVQMSGGVEARGVLMQLAWNSMAKLGENACNVAPGIGQLRRCAHGKSLTLQRKLCSRRGSKTKDFIMIVQDHLGGGCSTLMLGGSSDKL